MNTIVQDATSTSIYQGITARSLGKKILMAVSGLIAFGFVAGHMLGNLQIFAGQEQLNAYAEALHQLGPVIWVIRAFLAVFFIIHIYKGIQLKLENYASRPITYNCSNTVKATLASRTMIWTGLIVLAFVIYHLLHFTVRITHPEYQSLTDSLGRADVYSMVILGFRSWLISIFYIIAVGLLCYHLSHGIASMFQTVGWTNPDSLPKLEKLATIVALIFWLGYISIPIAVLTGFLTLPERGI
jgi:succinate dehydrogenase / fumarate reductase cytochrome b subunit